MRWLVWALAIGCGKGEEPAPDGDSGPAPVCNAGSAYAPGTPAFRDATADWGIPEEVTGIRLNAVDFDGDGWTDLAVRGGTADAWLLRNTGDGRFEDVTAASGILATRSGEDRPRPGAVWIWADVDNDGDLDVYTGLPDEDSAPDEVETSELLLNQGDGTFVLGPADNPIRHGVDQTYGAAFGDVDRDGIVDLWTTQYHAAGSYQQDHLYLGKGDGTFEKRTKKAGLETKDWAAVSDIDQGLAHSVAWAAEICDLNNDGWPELLASSYGRAPNHLWRNEEGGFVNASVASGYAFDHRTDWTDNESARCWCKLHPDADDCDGVPPPERIGCDEDADAFRWNHTYDRNPFRLGGNSGQTVCADLDNDGWIDLLTTEIVHWDVGSSSDPSEVLFNTQDPAVRFERPGNEVTGLLRERTGPTWDDGDITAAVFDFDNDGWKDLYIGSTDYPGTRGLLYRQVAPRKWEPVALSDGIDHPRSHGSVVADFDRDGDLDLVVGHSPMRCGDDCRDTFTIRLFENLAEDSNFVQLALVGGADTNRAAVGARVEVRAGDLLQVQEVDGGGGQMGAQSDLVVHFGLGQACEAEVTVVWPDLAATRQTFTVGAGYRYRVIQGEEPVAAL